MATVTFFHAHPDDEAIITAGTMVQLARAGHRVVLVVATRGELGEIPEGLLAPGETLAERRTAEQQEAARLLGVDRLVWLEYLDSGMEGEDTNGRPGAFAAAAADEAAARLAGVLREVDSQVLVTYDEHGGYGHPDHVQTHRVGMAAARLAGTPVVYLATVNRDVALAQIDSAQGTAWALPPEERAGMDTMGEPAARITTEVDVRDVLDVKRRAMQAHVSQIPEDSFFLSLPDEAFAGFWGSEWYIRVDLEAPGRPDEPLPVLRPPDGGVEDRLVVAPEARVPPAATPPPTGAGPQANGG